MKGFCRVSSQEKENLGKSFLFTIDKEERSPNEITITGHVETLLDLNKLAHYFLSPSSLSLEKKLSETLKKALA